MKLKTTIEQVTGFHTDGTPYVQLLTIETDPRDYPDADGEWLEKYHAARVKLASIRDPEHRIRATDRAAQEINEPSDLPVIVDRIIAESELKAPGCLRRGI